MISESHSDWKRWPALVSRRRQSWKFVSWPLCTTATSGNGYAQ